MAPTMSTNRTGHQPTSPWIDQARHLGAEYSRRLISLREFNAALAALASSPDSPVTGIWLEFHNAALAIDIHAGTSPSADRDYQDSWDLVDKAQLLLGLRRSNSDPSPEITHDAIRSIAVSFWKPDLRDNFGLLDMKKPQARDMFARTVEGLARNAPFVAIGVCDLDNFGRFNDENPEIGNQVIGELGRVLEEAAGDDALALHAGGDEFMLLWPTPGPSEVVMRAQRALHSIRTRVATTRGGVTGKIGVVFYRPGTEMPGFDKANADAQLLVKRKDSVGRITKEHGRVRLRGDEDAHPEARLQDVLPLAHIVVKTHITSTQPFESPWLNYISRQTVEAFPNGFAAIRRAVEEAINWIAPDVRPNVANAAHPATSLNALGDLRPMISPVDIAMATAHGIFRGAYLAGRTKLALELLHSRNLGVATLRVKGSEEAIWKTSKQVQRHKVWDFGQMWTAKPPASADGRPVSPSVLVQVGYVDLPLPRQLLAAVVMVDDRPAMGGGLPDFWEASLSQVIAEMDANLNIDSVLVTGDTASAPHTVQHLQELSSRGGDTEFISTQLGYSPALIRKIRDRLQNRVFIESTPHALAERLSDLTRPKRTVQPPVLRSSLSEPERVLDAETPDAAKPQLADGCRVESAAQAYPLVVQIARTFSLAPELRDQAGRPIHELLDFKVTLTEPSRDPVPAYRSTEREDFEAYFKREFLDPHGKFGSKFQEANQLGSVLDHIVHAITGREGPYATRRAILVVPHSPEPTLKPLGLVSTWIAPRMIAGRADLHFSFVWRTVEVLVGFPYSLYGSIRFAEHVTEQIKQRLGASGANVRFTSLSYIAHSMHFFPDEYGERIARRIVSDAIK